MRFACLFLVIVVVAVVECTFVYVTNPSSRFSLAGTQVLPLYERLLSIGFRGRPLSYGLTGVSGLFSNRLSTLGLRSVPRRHSGYVTVRSGRNIFHYRPGGGNYRFLPSVSGDSYGYIPSYGRAAYYSSCSGYVSRHRRGQTTGGLLGRCLSSDGHSMGTYPLYMTLRYGSAYHLPATGYQTGSQDDVYSVYLRHNGAGADRPTAGYDVGSYSGNLGHAYYRPAPYYHTAGSHGGLHAYPGSGYGRGRLHSLGGWCFVVFY